MLRTEATKLVVEDFNNINQVTDELNLPDDQTPWAYGGYFNEKSEFERIQGKQLNSSNSTGGQVLTIQQLTFEGRNVLFVHQSSNWVIEDDLTELMTQDPSPINPNEPFIL